jgi:hypothetical protein
MMDRQCINECAEAQPPRALPDRRQEHAWRRRHAQRREVVLCDVIGVKARTIESLDNFQPLLVILAQRQVIAVEMIENTKFQVHSETTHLICALSDRFCSSIHLCSFELRSYRQVSGALQCH